MCKSLSFVIIAYNEEVNLPRTLASILDQDGLEDFEIIVVNDGSTDRTAAVVQDTARVHAEVRLLDLRPNRGRGAARLAGAKAAKGSYVAFIDADIILPKNWLTLCLRDMGEYDGVGGTAVPDGDVGFLYRRFGLDPKVIGSPYPITGNNCLFTRAIFDAVEFDHRLRDGEDQDFNSRLIAAGYKLHRTSELIVRHEESISFRQSLRWLFQIGMGASRLLLVHRQLRIPDLAYFFFITLIVLSFVLSITGSNYTYLLLIPAYIVFTSIVHVMSRFRFSLSHMPRLILAITANSLFISMYYCGRSYGYAKLGFRRTAGVHQA